MSLTYKVVVSDDAVSDLRRYVGYLINVKRNPQAASNLLDDYDERDYFMLYRFEEQTAFITNIFHGLEDADNKLR